MPYSVIKKRKCFPHTSKQPVAQGGGRGGEQWEVGVLL